MCDLDMGELKVLAYYLEKFMNEPRMANAARAGEDLHQANADAWGVSRKEAKGGVFACVPYNTQALTRSGWKYRHELSVGMEVLGYNEHTGMNEWTTITHLHDYSSADVFTIKTPIAEYRATSDHRWYGYHNGQPCVFTTGEMTYDHTIHNVARAVGGSGAKAGVMEPCSTDWLQWVLAATTTQREAFLNGASISGGFVNRQAKNPLATDLGNYFEAVYLCAYLLGYNVSYKPTTKKLNHNYGLTYTKLDSTGHMSITHTSTEPVWCPTTTLGSWVMRQQHAITITGNCNYGSQAPTLAKSLGVTKAKAQSIIDSINDNMPAIQQLKEKVWAYGRSNGYIRLVSGHVIHYPNLRSNGYERIEAERQSFNALIQGSQAALFKQLVLLVFQQLKEYGCQVVACVHDELIFYAPLDIADTVCDYVTTVFNTHTLLGTVPLNGECKHGDNWYDAK